MTSRTAYWLEWASIKFSVETYWVTTDFIATVSHAELFTGGFADSNQLNRTTPNRVRVSQFYLLANSSVMSSFFNTFTRETLDLISYICCSHCSLIHKID